MKEKIVANEMQIGANAKRRFSCHIDECCSHTSITVGHDLYKIILSVYSSFRILDLPVKYDKLKKLKIDWIQIDKLNLYFVSSETHFRVIQCLFFRVPNCDFLKIFSTWDNNEVTISVITDFVYFQLYDSETNKNVLPF